ncbi:MAG: 3-dehydroquinate synthase, partial [Candidatus Omnitrophica bacterium]|nr:3-dehydroquinate synthase [Candidatus Omnitrophota bacterium]
YRRGVPLIQVPTTLLAQVDSSIGGKVAIDLPYGKNLVGAFYQPRLVLSELRFLKSLKTAQVRESLAEIIKYGVICDAGLFKFLETNLDQILKLDQTKLQHVIERCSKIKARIVEQDETDKLDKRITLNLGHTTAHALEAAAGFSTDYSHGFAVGLGMLVAAELARQLRLCSRNTTERIAALIERAGLPTKISGLKIKDILAAQEFDKKFSAGKNRFVLPVRIGKVIVKQSIPKSRIAKAIGSII